jgi:TetR/AcrR family transcriptional regulator, transcriptional repressor for nem operon
MARSREFEERAVLDATVQCFWSRGYEATSVHGLTDMLGITGGSLHNAFGDKRALYRRALDRYVEQRFGDRLSRFEGKSPPREALGVFFKAIIERSLSDTERKGCMLVNSALEMAPHDPELQRVVAEVPVRVEGFFGDARQLAKRMERFQRRKPPRICLASC